MHVWQRPVGQLAFRQKAAVREEVAEAISELIKEDPASSWLVISYKNPSIEDTLRQALSQEPEGGLHFLTWGMHHGTNKYAHCRNVVLVGQLTYGPADYPALALANGNSQNIDTASTERLLQDGEYRHNWLQALTRAHVRHTKGQLAGNCRAFVIASPGCRATELLEEVFPGSTVAVWSPKLTTTKGKAGELIALLEDAKATGALPIKKSELRCALSVNAPNFSRLLDHPAVRSYLDRQRLRVKRSEIGAFTGFTPWPDGEFSIEDLEEVE